LEETINYLSFFRSSEFTEEVLLKKHKIRNSAERSILARHIKEHVSISIDLANQAFGGKEELSYLPLYYSCLNLIKTHLLFMNKRRELNRNLVHGMSYDDKHIRRDFFNEEIYFYKKGAVPLYYRITSGATIGRNEKIKIQLNDIYAKVNDISAEYVLVSSSVPQIIELKGGIKEINGQKYIELRNHSNHYDKLPRLRVVKSIKQFQLTGTAESYLSKCTIANQLEIDQFLENNVNKYYVRNFFCNACNDFHLYTFVGGKKHVFNEEISIALAYFHLSNVIRYNPMHYRKLIDSKYAPLITSLRKNGYFTFIKSMIGHFHRENFDVNI